MINPNGSGFTDERAANEERHQRALDRWFGPETRDPYAAQARPQAVPAQATGVSPSAFAKPQPAPHVPFEVLVSQLQMQPGMMEHLDGIDLDGDGVADIQMGPPPADPMGRMQWQAMAEHRQAAAQAVRVRKARRKHANNRIMVAYLQALDPLFDKVNEKVVQYVSVLPARLRRPFLRAVDDTPGAYLDLYKEMRDVLNLELRLTGQGSGANRRVRVANHDVQHYPSTGNRGETESLAAREAERQALLQRFRSGKAREGDNIRYMELSGF